MNSNGYKPHSHWPTVSLNQLAEINPKLPGVLGSCAAVSFVPMSAISAETAGVASEETRTYQQVAKGYTPFISGDLLIAKITPCFENGKIVQARLRHSAGFGSTEFHVVRPYKRKLNPRYALHYLRQENIRRSGERRMTGSAGQRRVPEAFFAGLKIPLPPLSEQRRIAKILDWADALRMKRRVALVRLDSLIQSIFLDLFGDPARNPKGWPKKPLSSLATKFSDGPFGSNLKTEHYTDRGVRVVRLQNIGVGEFIDDDVAYVSERHFAKLKKHECLAGDVLVGTLGDPNLRACIQPNSLTVALNKADCVQIRPDKQNATASFICMLLNQASTQQMAQALMHGQTRVRISMGRLRKLNVPVPPISLQREFARQVARVEKLKAAQRTSLAEMDVLFASLQQRAFQGKL